MDTTPEQRKEEKRLYDAKRYSEQREKLIEQSKAWSKENSDKRNASYRKRYAANKERFIAKAMRYYRQNTEKVLAQKVDYRLLNRENIKSSSKLSRSKKYWENPEKMRADARNRRAAAPEYWKEIEQRSRAKRKKQNQELTKKWRRENPDHARELWRARRMLKASIPGSHTEKQWRALCKRFQNRCACCGSSDQLTRDHIVPITNPAATDFIENIQPLCLPCNVKKGNRNTIDYRQTPFCGRGQAVLFAI